MKISVLICAYDRKKFLSQAIDSVLSQDVSRNDFEIVVVKNFSDSLLDKLLEDKAIKNIISERKLLGEFLLSGIVECQGKYVAFLDDDDLWVQGKLSRLLRLIDNFPDLGYYHNLVSPIDEMGRTPEMVRIFERVDSGKYSASFGFFDQNSKISKLKTIFKSFPDFNNSSIAVRKDILLSVKEFLRKIPQSLDSFVFFSSLSSDCSIFLDDKKYTLYRHHTANITGSLTSVRDEDWKENQRAMLQFLETYGLILDMIENGRKQLSLMEAKRRYFFTALLADLVISNSDKRRIARNSLELLKVLKAYQTMLNLTSLVLALLYFVAPKFSISITRRALAGDFL